MPSARIPNALRVRAVLVSKSLKLIHRNTSIVSTFALTTIIIFTTLYLFYTVCDNYSYRMFSGPPIQHASIELECDRAASAAHCRPAHDDNSKDLTLTELLLSTAHKRKAPERGVEKLLSRIALSGVPLLDLTDFVLLADAVNAILGQEGRADLMSKAYLRERFSNLVLVRDKEIRVAPSNCFTAAFVEFMANASAATQVRVPDSAYLSTADGGSRVSSSSYSTMPRALLAATLSIRWRCWSCSCPPRAPTTAGKAAPQTYALLSDQLSRFECIHRQCRTHGTSCGHRSPTECPPRPTRDSSCTSCPDSSLSRQKCRVSSRSDSKGLLELPRTSWPRTRALFPRCCWRSRWLRSCTRART